MKMIKAILIDPVREVVELIELPGGDGEDFNAALQKALGCEIWQIATYLPHSNFIAVDEEGLLKEQPDENFFSYQAFPQPLAGRGVILGFTNDGYTISTTMTVEEVARKVLFLTRVIMNGVGHGHDSN